MRNEWKRQFKKSFKKNNNKQTIKQKQQNQCKHFYIFLWVGYLLRTVCLHILPSIFLQNFIHKGKSKRQRSLWMSARCSWTWNCLDPKTLRKTTWAREALSAIVLISSFSWDRQYCDSVSVSSITVCCNLPISAPLHTFSLDF